MAVASEGWIARRVPIEIDRTNRSARVDQDRCVGDETPGKCAGSKCSPQLLVAGVRPLTSL